MFGFRFLFEVGGHLGSKVLRLGSCGLPSPVSGPEKKKTRRKTRLDGVKIPWLPFSTQTRILEWPFQLEKNFTQPAIKGTFLVRAME